MFFSGGRPIFFSFCSVKDVRSDLRQRVRVGRVSGEVEDEEAVTAIELGHVNQPIANAMKTIRISVQNLSAEIEGLRENLRHVRQESLNATRLGDFRKVAKLTTEAANLNRAILEAQGLLAAAA